MDNEGCRPPGWNRRLPEQLSPSLTSLGCAGPQGSPPFPQVGGRLAHFRVVAEIMSGRSSTIFEVVDSRDERRVALKVLLPHLAGHWATVGRFRTEALLAAYVRHPCIVPVYESDSYENQEFFTMRLESGATLEDLAAEAHERRDESFYVEIAEKFADLVRGVALLHRQGIVHRDLKPSNVLLTAKGRYAVTDFGSALNLKGDAENLDGWIGGTVLYMSPEQLTPQANPFDPLGDIYSLGVTLYEVVTGHAPFPQTDDEDLARLKLTRTPDSPRHKNSYVPPALDAIIRQAMAVNPSARYQTGDALAQDLEQFAERKRRNRR